jgi:hypothetical protein
MPSRYFATNALADVLLFLLSNGPLSDRHFHVESSPAAPALDLFKPSEQLSRDDDEGLMTSALQSIDISAP